MGACGYVTPLNRKKQEIIELASELEAMGELREFTQLILEYDLLGFYNEPSKYEANIKVFVNSLEE